MESEGQLHSLVKLGMAAPWQSRSGPNSSDSGLRNPRKSVSEDQALAASPRTGFLGKRFSAGSGCPVVHRGECSTSELPIRTKTAEHPSSPGRSITLEGLGRTARPALLFPRFRPYPNEQLSEVLPPEQPLEGGHRILKPLCHILPVLDPALPHPLSHVPLELRLLLR